MGLLYQKQVRCSLDGFMAQASREGMAERITVNHLSVTRRLQQQGSARIRGVRGVIGLMKER